MRSSALRGGVGAHLIHHQMRGHFLRLFQMPGRTPTTHYRNLLLQWARPLVLALADLPLFAEQEEQDSSVCQPAVG